MKEIFYKEFKTRDEFSEKESHGIVNYFMTKECVSIEIKIDTYRYVLEEQQPYRRIIPEFGVQFKKICEDEYEITNFHISEDCVPYLYENHNISYGAKYFIGKNGDSLTSLIINTDKIFQDYYRHYTDNDEDNELEYHTFYELVFIIGIEADVEDVDIFK